MTNSWAEAVDPLEQLHKEALKWANHQPPENLVRSVAWALHEITGKDYGPTYDALDQRVR